MTHWFLSLSKEGSRCAFVIPTRQKIVFRQGKGKGKRRKERRKVKKRKNGEGKTGEKEEGRKNARERERERERVGTGRGKTVTINCFQLSSRQEQRQVHNHATIRSTRLIFICAVLLYEYRLLYFGGG